MAVTLLVVNDHWLKGALPSWWTGKLSDVAGLAFFPLLLVGLLALTGVALRAWTLVAACTTTAFVFALVKVWLPANEAYRVGLGVLQWPLGAMWAVAHGQTLPTLHKVALTMDTSDLLALPSVLVAWAVGRSTISNTSRPQTKD